MIELTCPRCGGAGTIPREKLNTRLICKKCHAVFHLTPSGRAALGDPADLVRPAAHHHAAELARSRVHSRTTKLVYEWPALPNLALYLGLLAVLGLVIYFVYAPERLDDLADRGKEVAQCLADGQPARLKNLALPETLSEVDEWYTETYSRYESATQRWPGRETLVGVLVVERDEQAGSAEILAVLAPSKTIMRNQVIIHEAISSASHKPVSVSLHFTRDSSGSWQLDGKKTLALEHKT